MTLRIYKLERTDRQIWGQYQAFVVISTTEEKAFGLTPLHDENGHMTPQKRPDVWTIQEIGIAHKNQKEGLVVGEYHEP